MVKAFCSLWENIFNYTGKTCRKDYWLAILANLILMYAGAIPLALIISAIDAPILPTCILYITIINIPVVAAYIRRGRDSIISMADVALITFAIPIVSGIIIGLLPTIKPNYDKLRLRPTIRFFIIGMGMFLYGGLLSMAIYGEPGAFLPVIAGGLFISTAAIIIGAFSKN